jgi:dipeptidyl aminopeptidase/acylaminoacyl peptidase
MNVVDGLHMKSLQNAVVLAAALVAAPAAEPPFDFAQSRPREDQASARRMSLVDLIDVPRISDPQISPDGKQIVYVRSTADWKANRRVTHIWRVDVSGSGAPVQFTHGDGEGETSPRWSPDGTQIAFLARRPEGEAKRDSDAPAPKTQVFVMDVAGGEARPVTKHPTSASQIAWALDGAAIYFVADDEKSDEEKKREKTKDDVYAFDENYEQKHLWRVNVGSGAAERVTSGDFSVLDYALSTDGTRIVQHRAPTPLFGDAAQSEVWIAPATGGDATRITTNGVSESEARLSPAGDRVVFTAEAGPKFENYYNGRVFVAGDKPTTGGEPRALAASPSHDVRQAAWSRDGRTIFFTAAAGLETQLFKMSADGGDPVALTRGRHVLRDWTYAPRADRHVFFIDDATSPGEIWTLGPESSEPVRVTRLHETVARTFRLARQEAVQWKGADGATVEGLLYYPVDYQQGRRYPLVVQTHGGPASADQYGFGSWGSYVQVLVGKGYAVLKPNYRGSTGYGDAFLRDMVGSYFRNSHLDVMAGVDHLVKIGIADPDRLAKMGWSAGGHMTNKIITFTNRFKAASSGAGAANWISMYAQSDVRTYRTPWFGGTPWQKNAPIDLYWDHSPLKDAASVRTPTIFLVGERDVRVPMPQSVEMYRALKANGVPTKLYIAPREPHGWQELRHQLFKMNVELEWFERWVTRRPYEWERAPGEEEKTL